MRCRTRCIPTSRIQKGVPWHVACKAWRVRKDIPKDKYFHFDYYIEILDCSMNTDPDFKRNHHILPRLVSPEQEMEERRGREEWVR